MPTTQTFNCLVNWLLFLLECELENYVYFVPGCFWHYIEQCSISNYRIKIECIHISVLPLEARTPLEFVWGMGCA